MWKLPIKEPVAVFFDAASGSLFVSSRDGDNARLAKVSLTGKLENETVAKAKGSPGPLRAYDGKLYWIAGQSVQVVDPAGGGSSALAHIATDKGDPREIALSRDGSVVVAYAGGAIERVEKNGASLLSNSNKPAAGLLQLDGKLHVLRGGILETISGGDDSSEAFCDCRGLERSGRQTWITVKGRSLLENRATLFTLEKELGRPAYVYRMDPAEDFVVLPVPDEGMLRAYRMPGAANAKGADKRR